MSQLFSAKRLETGAAAKQMSEQLTAEKYRSAGLEKQLFRGIAESYVNQGDVLHFEQTLSAAAVRELADAIAEFCDGVAAVFSGSDESGYSVCMICKNGDVRELGKAMNEKLNGRGGGKPGSFQGSVKATRKQIEEFFNNR